MKEKLASCSKREAMRKTMSMPNFVQVYDDDDDDDDHHNRDRGDDDHHQNGDYIDNDDEPLSR